MADIDSGHIEALGVKLEESFMAMRREMDIFRTDVKDDLRAVHARVSELRDAKLAQNGKVDKQGAAIGELTTDVALLKAGVVPAFEGDTGRAAQRWLPASKAGKVGAGAAGLFGLAGAMEVMHQVGPGLKFLLELVQKVLQP